MWKPRRLATVRASTACYRDCFTLTLISILPHKFVCFAMLILRVAERRKYGKFCLLECNFMKSDGSLLNFRRGILPPSSGSKNKPWMALSIITCLPDFMEIGQLVQNLKWWARRQACRRCDDYRKLLSSLRRGGR
jgi:hypothetical protein